MSSAVLVRGVNDVGSAVARDLFLAGYRVVLHDVQRPDDCHRTMAFTDAVFDGEARLEGVRAARVDNLAGLPRALSNHAAIPVITHPLPAALDALRPVVLIDARLRKRELPERQIGLAPLTIGLGPNFVASETTDLIVETGFGADLGRVYDRGTTRPLSGDPPTIAGHGRDRFVYAPAAGVFHTQYEIGDAVRAGATLGHIDEMPLSVPLDGVLRGLTHDDVPVTVNTRVIEVWPHGQPLVLTAIHARSARLAAAVRAAIAQRGWTADGAPVAAGG